jgi:hypothetical protein
MLLLFLPSGTRNGIGLPESMISATALGLGQ